MGCRHAGGDHDEDFKGCRFGRPGHETDALRAQNIGDLVRIDDDRRCTVGKDGPGELRHRDHARLDVDMAVDEPRAEESPLRSTTSRAG